MVLFLRSRASESVLQSLSNIPPCCRAILRLPPLLLSVSPAVFYSLSIPSLCSRCSLRPQFLGIAPYVGIDLCVHGKRGGSGSFFAAILDLPFCLAVAFNHNHNYLALFMLRSRYMSSPLYYGKSLQCCELKSSLCKSDWMF